MCPLRSTYQAAYGSHRSSLHRFQRDPRSYNFVMGKPQQRHVAPLKKTIQVNSHFSAGRAPRAALTPFSDNGKTKAWSLIDRNVDACRQTDQLSLTLSFFHKLMPWCYEICCAVAAWRHEAKLAESSVGEGYRSTPERKASAEMWRTEAGGSCSAVFALVLSVFCSVVVLFPAWQMWCYVLHAWRSQVIRFTSSHKFKHVGFG